MLLTFFFTPLALNLKEPNLIPLWNSTVFIYRFAWVIDGFLSLLTSTPSAESTGLSSNPDQSSALTDAMDSGFP